MGGEMNLIDNDYSVEDLEILIKRYKKSYYRGSPEITDYEYDILEMKLMQLDPDNPALSMVGFEEEE